MIDWPSYNGSLVRRGQVLLDFDVLDGWDHELSQMNLGMVGQPSSSISTSIIRGRRLRLRNLVCLIEHST
jgi:hypothetical protein